jgi:pyruvate kinase
MSTEISNGPFYTDALRMLNRICLEAEQAIDYNKQYEDMQLQIYHYHFSHSNDVVGVISNCAVKASFDSKASLIVVFTHNGLSALLIAKFKPKSPILAVTSNHSTANGLMLARGIFTY